MIIDCISDLHGSQPYLEGGDLLIIAGDLTARDEVEGYYFFNNWLRSIKNLYKQIVLIAGNHDGCIQNRSFDTDFFDAKYLQDEEFEFEGLKIYGSPWTPVFGNWYFMKNRGPHIKEVWDRIPTDTDILITHGPPFGIMDFVQEGTRKGRFCGCDDLYERLSSLPKLKLHVFGHIHYSYGHIIYKQDFPGVQFVNASVMNEDYVMVNKPIRIKL